MSHPLDGARLKIVRAEKHLKSVNEEIERYFSEKPYHFPVQRHSNESATVSVTILKHPPPELSCIIGDCVTNMRAALDYIAWEVFAKFKIKTLTEREEKRIKFPICRVKEDFSKPDGFEPFATKILTQTDSIAEFERVQFYNTGDDGLNILNTIVNDDKHRALLLCLFNIESRVEIGMEQGSKRSSNTGVISSNGSDNLQTTRTFPIEKGPLIVNVNASSTISITFENTDVPRRSIDQVLFNILKCVSNIITRFEQFFP